MPLYQYIVWFSDHRSVDPSLVGGKAASLGRLAQAHFPVPSGYSITTEAYAEFIGFHKLQGEINRILDRLDYSDVNQLDAETVKIRRLITSKELPNDLAMEIIKAYGDLGGDPNVAVRSSGTAEDLAEASFAGLHDTFLHIRGSDALLDTVRQCWASMWSARATAYRHHNGVGHDGARLAVVVQAMVNPDVAGVMFIGNPVTARTDEIVINASWGLGESVVSGIITPDEYILDAETLRIKHRTIATKGIQIIRDDAAGHGTVRTPVPDTKQNAPALTDDQASELGELGRRVTAYYDDLPQDIEWAIAEGALFLLQSRAVTGVEFTWDADVDAWQTNPKDDDTLWTRAWADAVWTGAITPLFYSVRAQWMTELVTEDLCRLWGFDDLAKMRLWKYRCGTAYYNVQFEEQFQSYILPPALRLSALEIVPPPRRADVVKAPFDLSRFLRMYARLHVLDPTQRVYKFRHVTAEYINSRVEEAKGLSDDGLRKLSDKALKEQIHKPVQLLHDFIRACWTGYYIYLTTAFSSIQFMLQRWYDGDNASAFTDLLSGLPERTEIVRQNHALWNLASKIRQSSELRTAFDRFEGRRFFEELKNSQEGQRFLAAYDQFLQRFGQGGQADRDIYYTRRVEDPLLDYEAIRILLTADGSETSPEENEKRLLERRERATAEVLDNIRKKPLGTVKAEAFKIVLEYVLKLLVLRDNARMWANHIALAKKRGFREIGRRLVERGILDTDRDFYFLSQQELYDVLDGRARMKLIKAKIAARMRVFERCLAREEEHPLYLRGDIGVDLEQPVGGSGNGVLKGEGTSRGSVSGTARVIRRLEDLGRLQRGDILVCNSTDPGWAPAFVIISGLVVETGGMLAHANCLAREHGLPAVWLRNAMKLVKDGTLITVDGDRGEVRVATEASSMDEEVFASV